MWMYILFYSVACLVVNHAYTFHEDDKTSHSLDLRHIIEGGDCSVSVAGAVINGICKDDREIDFDAAGFEEGCYFQSKPCFKDNHCEGHMLCYILFAGNLRLDATCLAAGGHCVKPGTRIDGILKNNICPCDYDCYIKIEDQNCTGQDHCQASNLPCGGTKDISRCDGDDFACCESHRNDANCNGVCQENKLHCNGWYVPDKCAGHATRQCCVPPGDDTDCTNAPYFGVCKDITKHPCIYGDYRRGLCSGPAHRQCCINGCVDFLEVNGKEVLSDCHMHGGCCRPFCEAPEEEIGSSCELTNPNGHIIGTQCKCCAISHNGFRGGGGVIGDPHFITLDSQTYNFNGNCSYVLLRECANPLGTPRFTVTTKHTLVESLRGNFKPYVDSTSVIVGTFRADLLHGNLVSINNEPAMHIHELRGWNNTDKGITVTPDKSMVKVDVEGEFTVWFNGNGRVNVAIDRQYHGKVCGLLGNANDNLDDDFQKLTPNGLELVSDVDEFANSWVAPNSCP